MGKILIIFFFLNTIDQKAVPRVKDAYKVATLLGFFCIWGETWALLEKKINNKKQ